MDDSGVRHNKSEDVYGVCIHPYFYLGDLSNRLFLKFKCILQTGPDLILIAHIEGSSVFKAVAFGGSSAVIFTGKVWPENTDFRVIPCETAFIPRMIEVGAFIAEFCDIA